MREAGFVSAERHLNENVLLCAAGGLKFRIYYWGMVWRHFDNPVHRHSFYEICYVVDGQGEYEDEGETFRLRAGSQFVSKPGHWHQIRSIAGMQLFFVAFEPAGERDGAAAEYESDLRSGNLCPEPDPENVSALLWRAMYKLAEYGRPKPLRELAALLLQSFAVTFGPAEKETAGETDKSRSSSQLVWMAKRFIRDNLSQSLKLEDVASYLHVSDRHLSRMFRKHGGETFGQCLHRERMQTAEWMLKTTVRTIQEIAEETGFQSVHYFTRVFTNQFGMPPGQYRKQAMERKENGAS